MSSVKDENEVLHSDLRNATFGSILHRLHVLGFRCDALKFMLLLVNKRVCEYAVANNELELEVGQAKPLPLTWVFKYKFDKHGFLTKFKARLCVRGDLQQLGDNDTYAATLAGRSFRILMAITAKFDLETRQLDAVNAFTNSFLDEDVFVMFPDGYHRQGWTLKLIRALYGLRRSPLLWQKDLTAALQDLGLTQCPDDPCIFQNPWMTVFFFVDES
ncbi:hypothetical protein HIM_11697 [Hirsutella minnesotensis 3608]|uniref:Reverse transcriptase Ty1/copia-type domain-containing protein n=1 Tax=Hirsutella minnesotensis 3608 TaxID=1043627 RepID=A0A0F7ZFC7_9HYPO|nr:hypothetical protein HIM_11697 [Hirsutella minnesotensis 3608]